MVNEISELVDQKVNQAKLVFVDARFRTLKLVP